MPASSIFFLYSAATSPSPSPSSFLIASICCRSRNSRCRFSIPSWTSLRILSLSEASARISRVHSISLRNRVSTSTVSRISTFRSSERSGEYPARSASWLGRSMPRTICTTSPAPRSSSRFSISALYSRASTWDVSLSGLTSAAGCAVTRSAGPVPAAALPTVARYWPCRMATSTPLGSLRESSSLATVPMLA